MPEALTREQLEELYLPKPGVFVLVDVPELPFFMVDGEGSPDEEPFHAALAALLTSVGPIKREARVRMGRAYLEPPVEGLWWADDMADLAAGRKDRLKWRLMVPAPAWADADLYAAAVAEHADELEGWADRLRLDTLEEGRCAQTMHVGSVAGQRDVLARLHGEYLPSQGLVACGPHHEIYLYDPRTTPEARRKTVLRQGVHEA